MPIDYPELDREIEALKPKTGKKTVGEDIADVGKTVARGVADVLSMRRLLSTMRTREALRKTVTENLQVINGHVSPRLAKRAYDQILEKWTACKVAFDDSLRTAAKHKKWFGDPPRQVLQDLAQTLATLQKVEEALRKLHVKWSPKSPIGGQGGQPPPGGLRQPGGRPPPVAPPPAPPPSPPRPKETPEQTEQRRKLEELEKKLRQEKEKHQQKHELFDKSLDELKDLLRQLGDESGHNDFKENDQPEVPPPHKKEFSPSMDERKKPKEGKESPLPVMFTIEPPLQGYYRLHVADVFDKAKLTWNEESEEVPYPQFNVQKTHKIRGSVQGKIALPLPAGYVVDPASIQTSSGGAPVTITYDKEHGVTYLESKDLQTFEIGFGKSAQVAAETSAIEPAAYAREQMVTGNFSADTESFLASIKVLSSREKAMRIAEYVQEKLDYSNDSAFNFLYKSQPDQYFQKIEQYKKVDCDVGNTYFAALCRKVGVPARLVLGFNVPGARDGKAIINSGMGHAWAEIWSEEDKRWFTIDAQPAADKQEDEDGPPVDTNNPEESVDLKQKPPKPKPRPHKEAKDQEKKLKEAKDENAKKAVDQNKLDELDQKQQELEKDQREEVSQMLDENISMLEDEATLLEKQNKDQAERLRQKIDALKKALEKFKQDPEDQGNQQEAKDAVSDTNRQAIDGGLREFNELRLRLLRERVQALAAAEQEEEPK